MTAPISLVGTWLNSSKFIVKCHCHIIVVVIVVVVGGGGWLVDYLFGSVIDYRAVESACK